MNEKPRKPVTLTGRRTPDDNRGNTFRSNDNERPTYRSPSDNEMQFRAANKFNENRGYGERRDYSERRDNNDRPPRRYDNDRPRVQYADRPRTPENDARARDQEMRRQNDRPRHYGERNSEQRYDNRGAERNQEGRQYDNRRRHSNYTPRPQTPSFQNDNQESFAAESSSNAVTENNNEAAGENGEAAPQRRSRLFRLHMQNGAPAPRKTRDDNAAVDNNDSNADASVDGKPMNAQRGDETRIFGVNACRAVFQNRPDAIVRMYVAQNRIPQFTEIMKYCAASRRAYHVIPEDELVNASGSEHHEGICMLIKRRAVMQAEEFLAQLPDDKECSILILENIGNPHNLGAVLRSAAHFGVDAVFVNAGAAVHSGATARVAEGGVEHVTLVEYNDIAQLLENLRHNFISIVTTSSHQSENIYSVDMPKRSAIFFGEEHRGLTRFVLEQSDLRIGIPGTGKIESLNVSVAAAVILSEVARRRPAPVYAEAPAADVDLPDAAVANIE